MAMCRASWVRSVKSSRRKNAAAALTSGIVHIYEPGRPICPRVEYREGDTRLLLGQKAHPHAARQRGCKLDRRKIADDDTRLRFQDAFGVEN